MSLRVKHGCTAGSHLYWRPFYGPTSGADYSRVRFLIRQTWNSFQQIALLFSFPKCKYTKVTKLNIFIAINFPYENNTRAQCMTLITSTSQSHPLNKKKTCSVLLSTYPRFKRRTVVASKSIELIRQLCDNNSFRCYCEQKTYSASGLGE